MSDWYFIDQAAAIVTFGVIFPTIAIYVIAKIWEHQ